VILGDPMVTGAAPWPHPHVHWLIALLLGAKR